MTEYAYSLSGDSYTGSFSSVDEALAAASDENGAGDGDCVSAWVGEIVDHKLSEVVDLDTVLVEAADRAVGDIWPESEWHPVPPECARTEFYKMLDAWADRFGLHPDCFTVKNAGQYDLAGART